MQIRHLLATAALAVAATFAAVGPASAVTHSEVSQNVRQALTGTGQVSVTVDGDTALLFGYSDTMGKLAAERAAKATPGIDTVINHIALGRS